MGYFEIKQVEPWLYSIFDPLGSYCYLAVGEEKALLYDAVYGVGDLRAAVRGITDKPLTVVLGHGHVDHVNGAFQFESVFLNEAEAEVCKFHTSADFRKGNLQSLKDSGLTPPDGFDPEAYVNARACKFVNLTEGMAFDLGGFRCEAVAMEGHTAGSIGLFIEEKRTLLVSDAANAHIWMFLNESLPIRDYVKMLDRVYNLGFDTFYYGHGVEPQPKGMFMKYKKAALEASIEKSAPYKTFPELKPYIYTDADSGVAIVFNASKL